MRLTPQEIHDFSVRKCLWLDNVGWPSFDEDELVEIRHGGVTAAPPRTHDCIQYFSEMCDRTRSIIPLQRRADERCSYTLGPNATQIERRDCGAREFRVLNAKLERQEKEFWAWMDHLRSIYGP